MPTEVSLSTNQDPAAEPLPAPEVEMVRALKVACTGDEARGLGHPRVWMMISPDVGYVDCGYCDKRFMLEPGFVDHDH
ncbi:MAG TPA: zinc-finger domain-containing protein [Paracoccus sp. (in: a-proteobacteria)]|nr:zinc-finger domain-containing protein [Paracoccus sp. (in: a-proteobacteria)]